MESTKNKIGMVFLVLIFLMFIIGGYYAMKYFVNNNSTNSSNKTSVSIKIDDSKDYIYYTDTEEIIEEVYKENVVLNFKGLESINETLKSELATLSSTKAYYTNQELANEEDSCENNLYSFKYREYEDSTYGNYVSLVINDYEYTCSYGGKAINTKSYVINKDTGSVYTEEELLSLFDVSEEDILESVKTRLKNTQVLEEDESIIDSEATISAIKTGTYGVNKALSVSKNGKLTLNFIVISNKINYNDSIEI